MLTTFSGVLFLDYPDYKRIIHLRNFCLQNTTVFWSKWTAMYHRRPIFDILDSSRLPEIFLPIDIIKWGTHHSLAGRGVDKLVVGIVNTYMQTILSGPVLKKTRSPGSNSSLSICVPIEACSLVSGAAANRNDRASSQPQIPNSPHRAASCHHNDTACHASFVAGRSNRQ